MNKQLGKIFPLAMTAVLFIASATGRAATPAQGRQPAVQTQKTDAADEDIYKAATAALGRKDYQEAADKLSVIVNKYPFSRFYEASLFQLGQSLFINGSREEGVKILETALFLYQGSPYSRDAALTAGDYYYELKRPADALKHYSFLLKNFGESLFIDLVYLKSGKLKVATGDMEGAAQDLGHLVQEHPQSPHLNEGIANLVAVYNRLGKSYLSAELFEKYPQRFPAMADDGQGLLAAADAYLSLGLYDRALSVLADFDGSYPKSRLRLDALIRKGKALKGHQEFDKAEKALKQALSINRQSPEAVLVLSTLYGVKGQTREALATLEAIPRPADDRIGMLLALQQGTLLSRTRKYGEALKAYDIAVSIAEKLKAADLQAQETLPRIYMGMGDVLYNQEKYPAAIEAYRKARDAGAAKEDLPWVLYRQGESWEKTANSAKAEESYQAVLAATTDPFWVGRANSRLEGIAWEKKLNKKEKTAQ